MLRCLAQEAVPLRQRVVAPSDILWAISVTTCSGAIAESSVMPGLRPATRAAAFVVADASTASDAVIPNPPFLTLPSARSPLRRQPEYHCFSVASPAADGECLAQPALALLHNTSIGHDARRQQNALLSDPDARATTRRAASRGGSNLVTSRASLTTRPRRNCCSLPGQRSAGRFDERPSGCHATAPTAVTPRLLAQSSSTLTAPARFTLDASTTTEQCSVDSARRRATPRGRNSTAPAYCYKSRPRPHFFWREESACRPTAAVRCLFRAAVRYIRFTLTSCPLRSAAIAACAPSVHASALRAR